MNAQTPDTSSSRPDCSPNKGGRPKKPLCERRDHVVKVGFDRLNYAKLKQLQQREGKSLSELVYEFAVNGYIKEALPQDVVKDIRALASMTNNLNQLAHEAHLVGYNDVHRENKALAQRIYDIAINLLHHNEYVSLKEFAKDLAEHGFTLTGRKNNNGKTVGIIFTMDGMSFAGGKIDKSLSLVNVMRLIDRYRDLFPGRAMFQEAKNIDSYIGSPYIAQSNSTSFTETNSLLSQSPLSTVVFNDDSTAAASGDSGIASRIIEAAVDLALQPDVSPTLSVGGGSGNNRDDDDDEKKRKIKNKNQPTQRTGRRR